MPGGKAKEEYTVHIHIHRPPSKLTPGSCPYGSEGSYDGSETAYPYCKCPQSIAHKECRSDSPGGAGACHPKAEGVAARSSIHSALTMTRKPGPGHTEALQGELPATQ